MMKHGCEQNKYDIHQKQIIELLIEIEDEKIFQILELLVKVKDRKVLEFIYDILNAFNEKWGV